MAAPIEYVLFDLDGTVWDSAPGIIDAMAHTLAVMGLRPLPPDELARHLGPPLIEMLAEIGVPHDRLDDGRDRYRARYRSHGESMADLYPGIVELLDALRTANLRLATATSKGIEPTRRMLEGRGLTDRFDVIAAASMDASAHHKVDVIQSALDQLGVEPSARVAIVGDRHYDLDGGRTFGLTTVGVSWGYGTADELFGCRPDHHVRSTAELSVALLGKGAP